MGRSAPDGLDSTARTQGSLTNQNNGWQSPPRLPLWKADACNRLLGGVVKLCWWSSWQPSHMAGKQEKRNDG